MEKNQIIKMEFTSGSSNTFNIEVNNKIDSNIECGGKAAGKINNDFFSAKYKFNIDVQTLKIYDIHFINVTHIGETVIPENTSKHNNSDTSSFSDITGGTFEQSVYDALHFILNNAVISKTDTEFVVELTNNYTMVIDFLVLHIKIGTYDCESNLSVHDKTINNNKKLSNSSSHVSFSSAKKSSKSNKTSQSNKSNKLNKSSQSSQSSQLGESSSELSELSKSSRKKPKKKSTKNVLKLLSWSIVLSFVMHALKNKVKNDKNDKKQITKSTNKPKDKSTNKPKDKSKNKK